MVRPFYADIAKVIGMPTALERLPMQPIQYFGNYGARHRVIKSDGDLCGYGGVLNARMADQS